MHQIKDERISLRTEVFSAGANWQFEHDCAYTLLGALLDERGIAEEQRDKKIGKFGKPYFSAIPALSFCISHTSGAAAAAISEYGLLGIDIESVRNISPQALSRLYSERERREIAESENPQRDFFTLWTLKESYAKALGCRLLDEQTKAAQFDINDKTQIISNIEGAYFEVSQDCGYILSVCLLPKADSFYAANADFGKDGESWKNI